MSEDLEVVKADASPNKRAGNVDFLTGTLWSSIIMFAIPIAITSVLQQLFNTADIAVVGRFVAGNDALAAVGCTGPIVTLIIALFSGLAIGANATIARHLGEGNHQKVHESVHASIAIAIIAGIIIMIIGQIIARPLLELVSTPDNVMDLAVLYLRIYFAGSPFLLLYNFESAIFRAAGDTKKPVYVLLCTGMVNIVLNLFFVVICKMSIDGVALATLTADVLSAGILFILLVRRRDVIQVIPKKIKYHNNVAKMILFIGIPSAIQGMLFNIANIILQSGVNGLGSDVVAGSTVGLNIEIYAYFIITGVGQAAITFNSQNLGAGNIKRCEQSTKWSLIIGIIVALITSTVLVLFRRQIAGVFTDDPAVIEIAATRVLLIAGFEVINVFIEVLSGALRGLGYSSFPAALCVIFICGVRIVWLFFIFPMNKTFAWLMTIYPISWACAAVALIITYLIVRKKVRREHASIIA